MAQRALELERLNADLNQFARGISHDLKAPITSIAGLLNICLEDLEDGNHGELAENLGKAIAIAERSVADIEQVLSVISNPEQDAMPEPVDLAVMAQEIWDDLNGSETGRRFELDHLSGCDPVVERATLRTVLRHLFSNAIRFRDEARAPLEVRLQTLVTEGVFTLTLSDNGVGMPERFLSQAFDLFTRCDDRGGAGIGLNLVKRNMERLGGTVEVVSTLGVGTVVTLTLPLKQKELAA
jgi:signal transduction histidine kinase